VKNSESPAPNAMTRYRITIRRCEGIALGERIRWNGRILMIRQLLHDPRARDRIAMRCEEVRGRWRHS